VKYFRSTKMADSKNLNQSLWDMSSPQNGGPRSASRTWRCPKEELLAAYLEGTMAVQGKSRLESHLADCERCRILVADIVKLRRLEPPLLPLGLMQRALMLCSPKSRARRWRWIFVPAAATAAVLFAAIVINNRRTPQPIAALSPPASSAPLIAKSQTPLERSPSVEDVVRKGTVPGLSPTVISPQSDGVITSIKATFRWSPVALSRYYEIHLTRQDGDLIWEANSEKTVLRLPGDITLKNGPYFVWITAYLQDGRVAKSQPTKFWVNDSP
jgi:Putative zinc-finger